MTQSGEIRTTASRCAYCGAVTSESELCSHHGVGCGGDWARENRIMCDFIHRGIAMPVPGDCVVLEAA